MNETPDPMVYLSLYQFPAMQTTIHLRTRVDPEAMVATVESSVHSLDPDLPVFDEMTLESNMRLSSTFARVGGVFVGGLGLIALALAAVGIYGVVAYTTRQRTHEIGIRIALGASRAQILKLVVGQGLRLILAGLVIGLAGSYAVTRLLRDLLFGISATDAATLVGVSLLLIFLGLLACYLPARTAMRIDPTTAVRAE